ncbi:MAG: baseplate J/gp47 family protein [Microscillaceae bacterium]|jgi:hypothetical protein|nr:baseplate J/gp47 family protein [Microscillaceae bacterium]
MNQELFEYNSRSSSSQETRFLPTLDYNKVQVDERSLDDLLLFSAGLAKLIKYFNLKNEAEGDWADFFNDELVVLSTVLNLKTDEIENQFKTYLEKAVRFNRVEKKRQYLQKSFQEIYKIVWILEQWFQKMKLVEEFANIQTELRDELFNVISGTLDEALDKFRQLTTLTNEDADFKLALDFDYSTLSPVWQVAAQLGVEIQGNSIYEKTQSLANQLDTIFQPFFETLIYLKNKAHIYIDQSLKSDTHYPEMALLVAFLRLYQYPQQNLNEISKRYLDFYYQEILKQTPLKPISDKAYLKFQLNDNALFVNLKKGEKFSAGEYENGNNITYTADYDTQLNRVDIQKVYTVYSDFQQLTIRGLPKKIMSGMLAQEIPVKELTPNPNNPISQLFATFGESVETKTNLNFAMQEANLGFAIASPSLFLSEGERDIAIILQFTPESFAVLNTFIADLSLTFGETEDEIFIKSFLEAFHIYITTDKAWLNIKRYVVVRLEKEHCLKISFGLSGSEASIVGFQNTIHSGSFATHLPVVKFILNNQSYLYPYTLLKSLILEEVTLKTEVKGVKDLILHSQMGELSADAPFYPFGSVPNVGSYLIIGKNEIFQKSLDSLSIDIEWFNLPKDRSGFFGHYLDYELPLDNTSFEVNLSIMDKGRWIPENAQLKQKFKLFSTENATNDSEPQAQGILNQNTNINEVDITNIKLPANYAEVAKPAKYHNLAQRGFIKLELTNPEFAFAHNIYPAVLSDTVVANAQNGWLARVRNGFRKPEPKKLPNLPYTPQIKSIALNYSSTSVISLKDRSTRNENAENRGQFFHIHPFGENLEFPDYAQQFTYLLPEFNAEGSLLLGLSNVNPPQTVSILFELTGGTGISSEEEKPIIEWSYLSNDEWQILPQSKILQEGTENFIKTGIIVLELPSDLKNGNTILHKDYYWLRASVIKNIQAVSKLKSINTQIVTATLDYDPEQAQQLAKALPAFSIQNSLNNIIGVQKISQPLSSFGGRSQEDQKQFYTRISERLRHKQRAISPWDYERLILEKFPMIQRATCLPNMTSQNLDAPGSVLLIVTPFLNNELGKLQEPKVSSEVLYEIKSYLQQFISPFVRLEVRNPSYERVKIICDVKLAVGYGFGYYVQKLSEDLNYYLTNNMLGSRKAVELGGKINTSDVMSFMRTLPYIEFITRFSMVQVAQDFRGQFMLLDTADAENTKTFLQATKPWSVLVPASAHQISILDEKNEVIAVRAGVGNLQISSDFVIN